MDGKRKKLQLRNFLWCEFNFQQSIQFLTFQKNAFCSLKHIFHYIGWKIVPTLLGLYTITCVLCHVIYSYVLQKMQKTYLPDIVFQLKIETNGAFVNNCGKSYGVLCGFCQMKRQILYIIPLLFSKWHSILSHEIHACMGKT